MTRLLLSLTISFQLLVPLTVASPHEWTVNIRDMGASGIKSEDATTILQAAIDRCNSAGGGSVFIPPGEYTATTIELKSNVTLYLAAGAILYASNDSSSYQKRVRVSGKVKLPALIFARGANNIAIKGSGVIMGQPQFYMIPLESYDFIQEEYDIARAAGLTPVHWLRKEPLVLLVFLTECEDVTIEDVALIDSPFWALHAHWCHRLKIRGLFIQSELDKAANSDGIDIDGCRDVTISDCIVQTADDAVCLKSTINDRGFRDCENVVVSNCVLTSTSCALKIGTESYGNFTHILFNNCVIRNSNRGLGIFIRDGGKASHIIFSNITMECHRKPTQWWGSADALRFVVLKRRSDSKVGAIEDVLVKDLIAETQGTSRIEGLPGYRTIKNITLAGIRLFMRPESQPDKRCTQALTIRDADHVEIRNVAIQWDQERPEPKWESALCCVEVRSLLLDNFRASSGNPQKGLPVLAMKNVQLGVIQNCMAEPPAPLFCDISGASTENLVFKNNMLKFAGEKLRKNIEVKQEAVVIDEASKF